MSETGGGGLLLDNVLKKRDFFQDILPYQEDPNKQNNKVNLFDQTLFQLFQLNQGSFDHVKVRPTPILELHNLWHKIHMFLDILEFRIENNI